MLTHQDHPKGSPEHGAVKTALLISAASLVIATLAVAALVDAPGQSDEAMAALRSKAYLQPKPLGSVFEPQHPRTQTAQIFHKPSVQ